MHHTDISDNDWIGRQLPPWSRPYARLMRLDRPIGSWLLLLPCWWGIALAGGAVPDLWLMILFAIGAVVMRGVGCIINDIMDRDFDRKVERTRTRPLASGAMGLFGAVVLAVMLSLIGLGVLLLLNDFSVWLGLAIVPIVVLYPLAKRVTWWPQLVLGLAFNWGALVGWSAVRGDVTLPAVLLYAAGVLWTLGYDTIYAHQDKADDDAIGIKSSALRLGAGSRQAVAGFYAASVALLAIAGSLTNAGIWLYVGLALAALQLFWQIKGWGSGQGWNPDDPSDCLRRFRSNRNFGLLVLAAIIAGNITG